MSRAQLRPNAENASFVELETAAKCARTQREHNRYRALMALIMGFERRAVAGVFGVSERAVRRWISAFNKEGVDGLLDEPKAGRPRAISAELVQPWCELLEHPERAGYRHWTGVKFHGYLRKELEQEIGYSTVIRFLHQQNYRLKVPQPWSDRQDEVLREQFRQELQTLVADDGVCLWFCDECGFEGDPRPRRRWAKKGQKARITKNGDHLRMNATGIVCPQNGEFYALEFTHTDSDVFQAFLAQANQDLTFTNQRQVLIVDNASWHKRQNLNWGRFEVRYLPPYSPDLNPIERLWLLIKAEWFADFIAKTRDELIARLDQALLWVINRQELNQQTCSIRT